MRWTDVLDRYFRHRAAQDLFSGAVLITQGATRLYARAYGYASRPWRVPNTLDTRFDTASVTKLFTAIATLQLIDRGLLDFDTPAVERLGLQGTTLSKEVNVFHLLTHTSGIGDDADEEAGERYEDLWKTKPNYSVVETRDFLPQFANKPANFPPGQGCRYCNCGYVLLGLLIETISGMTYRDYVRAHVFAPAGMTSSGFFRMDRVNHDVAEGCDPIRDATGTIVDWKKNIYSFPPIGSPDGGAHVTVADLDRFLRAVRAGELLSPELTGAFLTPQVVHRTRGTWTEMYGYGLSFYVDQASKVVCLEKEGVNVGVSGLVRHFPDQDIAVTLLSNMEDGVWDPARKIHEMVVDGQMA
ncbi:MAG: Beta-lactamase class C-like and penicillin binding proteins (PBPs) superfamily [uncultured Rubrobacteraceae bacterium]|uniref:Beta-lactamase class C-like and penicillin binding proteins (PBPs) superfamily n=1 Tax=uncultured Rubrobacteraceae bacterium TaxID=349277 RepID=A0A6J4TX09_9ACTN|nr:MAG: Beta-lactamase class C-like and penicillin binding proteins (PBPs) superfamily [uncultured Rubrobacteraceae bacterium]